MPVPLPTRPRTGLPAQLDRITRARWFRRLIVVAILLGGIDSGLRTYPALATGGTGLILDGLEYAVLLLFIAEIAMRIGAYGARPWLFFTRGWNVFDFLIVALCVLPLHAEYIVVLRLVRLLRLFTALHELQVLITGLVKGIPSLGYVGLLLLLHFYIYAVIGTFAFGDNDPIRFGSLHRSMLTLFQVLTLEGWNDILNTQFHGSDVGYDDAWKTIAEGRVSVARPVLAAGYFVSFILIGTMIILNVVAGVVIRSMEEASDEVAAEALQRRIALSGETPHDELRRLGVELQALAARIAAVSQSAATRHEPPA